MNVLINLRASLKAALGGLLMMGAAASPALAQSLPDNIMRPDDAAGIFMIYPGDGVPPGFEDFPHQERTLLIPWRGATTEQVRNINIPTLTMFAPEGEANGTAVIVAPGGAYHYQMVDLEGYRVARWLAGHGITAFVLKYRVAPTPADDEEWQSYDQRMGSILSRARERESFDGEERRLDQAYRDAMVAAAGWGEEDGRQAVRYLRENAASLNVDPEKIGMLGFSAGGGVSMGPTFRHDDLSRPDFVGAIYTGYTMQPVPENAPRLFLAIAEDDEYVDPDSVIALYQAWHQAGQPVELHVFGNGHHGFNIADNGNLSDSWRGLFLRWLADGGFLPGGAE